MTPLHRPGIETTGALPPFFTDVSPMRRAVIRMPSASCTRLTRRFCNAIGRSRLRSGIAMANHQRRSPE